MTNWISILLKLNFVGIQHQESWTSMNFKGTCLIMEIWGEFLLFTSNFNVALEASLNVKFGENIKYLCILLCGEALRQFDTLSAEVGSATQENLMSIILCLGKYFPLLMRYQSKSAQCAAE